MTNNCFITFEFIFTYSDICAIAAIIKERMKCPAFTKILHIIKNNMAPQKFSGSVQFHAKKPLPITIAIIPGYNNPAIRQPPLELLIFFYFYVFTQNYFLGKAAKK